MTDEQYLHFKDALDRCYTAIQASEWQKAEQLYAMCSRLWRLSSPESETAVRGALALASLIAWYEYAHPSEKMDGSIHSTR